MEDTMDMDMIMDMMDLTQSQQELNTHQGGFGYDTHVKHPSTYHNHHSTSYGHP